MGEEGNRRREMKRRRWEIIRQPNEDCVRGESRPENEGGAALRPKPLKAAQQNAIINGMRRQTVAPRDNGFVIGFVRKIYDNVEIKMEIKSNGLRVQVLLREKLFGISKICFMWSAFPQCIFMQ